MVQSLGEVQSVNCHIHCWEQGFLCLGIQHQQPAMLSVCHGLRAYLPMQVLHFSLKCQNKSSFGPGIHPTKITYCSVNKFKVPTAFQKASAVSY